MRNRKYDPQKWVGKMKDVPVFLIGNAPSLRHMDISFLKDYFTIGMNRIFYIFEPSILIWQDMNLWITEKDNIKKINSLMFIRNGSGGYGGEYKFRLNYKHATTVNHKLNELQGRGSTGSLAYQLAYALGCNPIFLVGMDCAYDGEYTDFYGKNTRHKKGTLPNCIRGLKFILNNLHDRTVYSCSKDSVFSDDKRISIEDALKLIKYKKISKEEIINRLS